MTAFREEPASILDRLRALRTADAPTHGGRVLSYVYDPDDERLDELAGAAMRIAQPVNWLDPTTFPSAAAIERDLLGFVRGLLHGDEDVVGTVTTTAYSVGAVFEIVVVATASGGTLPTGIFAQAIVDEQPL